MADHPATFRTIFHSQEPDTKSLYQQSTAQSIFSHELRLWAVRRASCMRYLVLLPVLLSEEQCLRGWGEASFGRSVQAQLTEPQLASLNCDGA